jgi:hypothetical protein
VLPLAFQKFDFDQAEELCFCREKETHDMLKDFTRDPEETYPF